MGAMSFFVAVLISWPSQLLVGRASAWLALPILVAIMAIAVAFDIVGVAVTAAHEAPFHARAAKRQMGAKESLSLIRRADVVANFCTDVVGDLAGTITGALGSAVIIHLTRLPPALGTALMVGMISGVSIGIKALSKNLALRRANDVMQLAGNLIAWGQQLRARVEGGHG